MSRQELRRQETRYGILDLQEDGLSNRAKICGSSRNANVSISGTYDNIQTELLLTTDTDMMDVATGSQSSLHQESAPKTNMTHRRWWKSRHVPPKVSYK